MSKRDEVIEMIREAFASNEYPGDQFLQGSYEGCEPFETVGPFKGKDDWQALDSKFLDADSAAVNFFSEAAFRFYLPAYLIADLREELQRVDMLFHLTGGFHDSSVKIPTESKVFVKKIGRSAFVNPRRYGAMTWRDYARYRLSIFSQEEAKAIVAYLEYKRDSDQWGLFIEAIEAALKDFWLERASNAPSTQSLKKHIEEEAEYLKAIT